MTELVVTRGLPASGKTTFARAWVTEKPGLRARVNRDDLREQLYGRPAPLPHEFELAVSAAEAGAVRQLLESKRSVVVDATHLKLRYVRAWEELARDLGVGFRVESFAHVPVETCVSRDDARRERGERWVGAEVIREMSRRFQNSLRSETREPALELIHPLLPLRYKPDTSLPGVWLCDLDGTLALHNGRSPYDYSRCGDDLPHTPVIEVIEHLLFMQPVLFLSGRPEAARAVTEAWLLRHVPYLDASSVALFMRDDDDNRADDIVKREIFFRDIAPRYHVRGVFDDRNRVVRMWRSLGLTCFAVAEGNF